MQSLETLLKRGFTDRCEGNELAARFEESALNIVRGFHTEVDRIRKTYRQDVAPQKVRERAQAVLRELESGPGGIVRLLGCQWATARESLATKAGLARSTDPGALSRESWLCDKLSAMEPGEQMLTLQRAIDLQDAEMMRAALYSPPSLRVFRDPRILEEARSEWYKRHLPEQVAEYEGLAVAHECERANYDSAVSAIKEIGGIESNLRERLEAAHPTGQPANQ